MDPLKLKPVPAFAILAAISPIFFSIGILVRHYYQSFISLDNFKLSLLIIMISGSALILTMVFVFLLLQVVVFAAILIRKRGYSLKRIAEVEKASVLIMVSGILADIFLLSINLFSRNSEAIEEKVKFLALALFCFVALFFITALKSEYNERKAIQVSKPSTTPP